MLFLASGLMSCVDLAHSSSPASGYAWMEGEDDVMALGPVSRWSLASKFEFENLTIDEGK